MSEAKEIQPFGDGAESSPEQLRDKIFQLEAVMKQMPGQVEIETRHHFSDGLYAREIFIPKGVTLTGKIHKFENMNILSKGDISVLTDEGVKRIKAPAIIVSRPGTKRVGYAHEDTVWVTIHATQERDLDKIEEHFIAETFQEFLDHQERKLIEEG